MKKLTWIIVVLMVAAMLFSGCTGRSDSETSETEVTKGTEAEAEETVVKTVDNDLADMTWEEILAEADGQTVNWYAWGGSPNINTYVQEEIAARVAEYGVTLNWVAVTAIPDAINKTMAEKQAGLTEGGEVDMFWINGANFMTSQQAGILFGPWAEQLDNAKYVDWTSAAINSDMGFPVNGMESPWSASIAYKIYDTTKTDESTLPMTFQELIEWTKANPGKYTYVAPPAFFGTRQIKEWMMEEVGLDILGWNADEMTQDEFYEATKSVWDGLEEMRPYLWRNGETFPKDISEVDKALSDGEISFSLIFSGMGITGKVINGQLPETAKTYCTNTSIGDTNYVAITYNSDNKAGAMVVANELIDPEVQAMSIETISFAPTVDYNKLTPEQQSRMDEATASINPDYYVPASESASKKVPEFSAAFNKYIENIWAELFLN